MAEMQAGYAAGLTGYAILKNNLIRQLRNDL
jgi:hypothetical protein